MDAFDNPGGPGWEIPAGQIEGGKMEIIGNDNWDGAWRHREFLEGEGALIDFSFSEGSTFTVHMNNGGYGSDEYRRFGLYFENDYPMADVYVGPNFVSEDFSRELNFQAEKTYEILIAILPGQELLEVVWDPSNPSERVEYRRGFSELPAGSAWSFLIEVNRGRIIFDNFQEISFSGAK